MTERVYKIFLLVVLPLGIGFGIYLTWRPDSLLMFHIVEGTRAGDYVDELRTLAASGRNLLPHWVIFSLPYGLWVFSGTAAFCLIWPDRKTWASWAWISSIPILGISLEVLQAFLSPGLVAGFKLGTFDVTDLILLVLSSGLAIFVSTTPYKKKHNDQLLPKKKSD